MLATKLDGHSFEREARVDDGSGAPEGYRIKKGDVVPDVTSMKSTKRANAGVGGPNQQPRTLLISEAPSSSRHVTLDEFDLRFPTPLSQRAASGFLARVTNSSLRVDNRFVADLRAYTR
jgi:hypothetical protein